MERRIEGKVYAVLNPMVTAAAYGLIGRGVVSVRLTDSGELVFTMSDGKEISSGNIQLPAASYEALGGIKVGENLKITPEGLLSVDTAGAVEKDNTKPVTSGAVHMEIGNIEALLENI